MTSWHLAPENTRLDLVEARSLYVRHGSREIPGPYVEICCSKDLGRAS
ncbi:hypothetical protein [Streptomyces sp. TRM68367]